MYFWTAVMERNRTPRLLYTDEKFLDKSLAKFVREQMKKGLDNDSIRDTVILKFKEILEASIKKDTNKEILHRILNSVPQDKAIENIRITVSSDYSQNIAILEIEKLKSRNLIYDIREEDGIYYIYNIVKRHMIGQVDFENKRIYVYNTIFYDAKNSNSGLSIDDDALIILFKIDVNKEYKVMQYVRNLQTKKITVFSCKLSNYNLDNEMAYKIDRDFYSKNNKINPFQTYLPLKYMTILNNKEISDKINLSLGENL